MAEWQSYKCVNGQMPDNHMKHECFGGLNMQIRVFPTSLDGKTYGMVFLVNGNLIFTHAFWIDPGETLEDVFKTAEDQLEVIKKTFREALA